ncbi:DNA mismatch repair protein MutT [Caulobacter sp. CCUG 60055]|uniref:NUDIX domain-containing protein n=1 Tax=Caulobacter sp. CCUG 60055 TaxID=2100090 RepID=UPI001FA6F381|nr:DNA mismatch repair protein MutT [Caulobacter sp. CCUG 60055]
MRPVRPRHAASLVLVRRDGDGVGVLMGRRPARSAFAPDVFVFPGGAVEPGDYEASPVAPLADACAKRAAASPRLAQALAAAALRETAEETGLVLPGDFSGLTLLARAITPTQSPIRFHARFFGMNAGEDLGDPADSPELADLGWRTVRQALALPLIDITEAVLRSLEVPSAPPFRFTYRSGRPVQTPLL